MHRTLIGVVAVGLGWGLPKALLAWKDLRQQAADIRAAERAAEREALLRRDEENRRVIERNNELYSRLIESFSEFSTLLRRNSNANGQ